LQDAGELWLQLPAGEYFELVNEAWLELDRIFRRHGGRHGKHPGEGMVCHFLPQPSASYLWSALVAAHQTREAMRQISSRWQARKGWDFELCMNTGVDEGQEWLGALRLSEPLELTVVGGAADHAAQLSRSGRDSAVWITRNLVGKLSPAERSRVSYGVPRDGRPSSRPVLSSFARLADLAAVHGSPAVPAALADLPITELLDLDTVPHSSPSPARPQA
jgi:class 3 adenylate cyclase